MASSNFTIAADIEPVTINSEALLCVVPAEDAFAQNFLLYLDERETGEAVVRQVAVLDSLDEIRRHCEVDLQEMHGAYFTSLGLEKFSNGTVVRLHPRLNSSLECRPELKELLYGVAGGAQDEPSQAGG
jgi:hypothetical protein